MTVDLQNHTTVSLSDLELRMVRHVPEGGNWQDIPDGLSGRVDQIRERSKTRGLIHTTYYGRLRWDEPAYTISTFFTRSGNGCFMHPEQDRLISAREAARLQSFPDSFVFGGAQRSVAQQIGNAIPPLLAYQIGAKIGGDTVVDLFSGAGGLSLGLEWAGKSVLLAVDSDAHSLETLLSSHASGAEGWKAELGSAESIDELRDRVSDLGGCDLLVGGPPCQSFSTAGLRADDARSTLVNTFVDAVTAVRPRFVLMENVLGLRSFKKGEVLRTVMDDLAGFGYSVDLWDLAAEQFGVPQRRRRLFVVGSNDGALPSQPRPIFPPFKKGGSTPVVTVRNAISDLPALEPGQESGVKSADLPDPEGPFQQFVRGQLGASELIEDLRDASDYEAPQQMSWAV